MLAVSRWYTGLLLFIIITEEVTGEDISISLEKHSVHGKILVRPWQDYGKAMVRP